MNLKDCPLRINEDGLITLHSFVRYDIAERAYRNSGKSFLFLHPQRNAPFLSTFSSVTRQPSLNCPESWDFLEN